VPGAPAYPNTKETTVQAYFRFNKARRRLELLALPSGAVLFSRAVPKPREVGPRREFDLRHMAAVRAEASRWARRNDVEVVTRPAG
jgi:hypothetical protein